MTAIHADGRVYCSNAVIDGRFGLRACVMNFRTEAADVERLLAVAAELGASACERHASGSGAPCSASGRGPWMRRSDSSIGTSLMLASRRRM